MKEREGACRASGRHVGASMINVVVKDWLASALFKRRRLPIPKQKQKIVEEPGLSDGYKYKYEVYSTLASARDS